MRGHTISTAQLMQGWGSAHPLPDMSSLPRNGAAVDFTRLGGEWAFSQSEYNALASGKRTFIWSASYPDGKLSSLKWVWMETPASIFYWDKGIKNPQTILTAIKQKLAQMQSDAESAQKLEMIGNIILVVGGIIITAGIASAAAPGAAAADAGAATTAGADAGAGVASSLQTAVGSIQGAISGAEASITGTLASLTTGSATLDAALVAAGKKAMSDGPKTQAVPAPVPAHAQFLPPIPTQFVGGWTLLYRWLIS